MRRRVAAMLMVISTLLLSCAQSIDVEPDVNPSDFSISIEKATRTKGGYDFEIKLENNSEYSRCFEWFRDSPWRIHFLSRKGKHLLRQDVPDFISQSMVDELRKDVEFLEISAGSRLLLTANKSVPDGALFDRDGVFVRRYREGEQFVSQVSLILYDCSFEEKNDALIADEYIHIKSQIRETMLVF